MASWGTAVFGGQVGEDTENYWRGSRETEVMRGDCLGKKGWSAPTTPTAADGQRRGQWPRNVEIVRECDRPVSGES